MTRQPSHIDLAPRQMCRVKGKVATKTARWTRTLAALALIVTSQGAWSACYRWGPNAQVPNVPGVSGYYPPEWTARYFQIALPRTVLIDPNAPLGAELDRFEIPVGNGAGDAPMGFCGTAGGTTRSTVTDSMPPVSIPPWNRVYATTITGIGLKLSFINELADGQIGVYEWPATRNYSATASGLQIMMGRRARFLVQLVKTERFTGSGKFTTAPYAEQRDDRGELLFSASVTGMGIVVQTPTCSVAPESKTIQVMFGKVPQSSFQGPRSFTAERDFNIRLICKAGAGMKNMIYLRLDAIADPSGNAGVLQLSPSGAGTAAGVGIQVLDAGKQTPAPVAFGRDMLVGPSMQGDYLLPFKARYFQTGERVKAGTANGTATFTIQYK